MANEISTLERRLDSVANRLSVGVARILREVAGAIAEEIVLRTPVVTGYARGNWRPSINAPAIVPISQLDPTGQITVSRVKATARKVRAGDTIFLVNRAPYIGRLAAGSSVQAPAGWIEEGIAVGTQTGIERAGSVLSGN